MARARRKYYFDPSIGLKELELKPVCKENRIAKPIPFVYYISVKKHVLLS